MGNDDQRGRYFREPAVIRGDDQVEFGFDGLVPGNENGAEAVEQGLEAVLERVGAVQGEHHLDPGVGVEHGDHVEQPVERGRVVHDDEDQPFGDHGGPVPGLAADRDLDRRHGGHGTPCEDGWFGAAQPP